MRFYIYILFFFLFISKSFLSQATLDSVFKVFKQDKYLENGNVSFCVMKPINDSILYSFNDTISLTPASIIKLFSTASAFEILGKDYKPETKIFSTHKIDENGILHGDLIIKGEADISLGSHYFNSEDSLNTFLVRWVDSLYSLGIREIRGNIIGDGSSFGYEGAPDGWSYEDVGNYYGAFPCGLSIYDNMLRYYFSVPSPRYKPILKSTFPIVPNLKLNNQLVSRVGVGDNSVIYGNPYNFERSIRGSLQANTPLFLVKGSLPDPEQQFLISFRELLMKKGINISGNSISLRNISDSTFNGFDYDSLHLIFSHKGKSVSQISYWTNHKSVNVFAESLLSWIGYAKTGKGTNESSISFVSNFWKNKIYSNGMFLTDGSGLSRSNALNARNFCSLLNYMFRSTNKNDFISTIPLTGVSGTVAQLCKGQCTEGKIYAKSGSMKRVKSFAGYVQTSKGDLLSFTIIVNNFNCSSYAIAKKIEPLLNAIYLNY